LALGQPVSFLPPFYKFDREKEHGRERYRDLDR
jgi:hypothetical protein